MLKEAAREMLEDRLIPFWLSLRDRENGGFYGYMDHDLNLRKGSEKGCILNSRILWFFSRCAGELVRPDLLEAAKEAYIFLRDCFVDRRYGGLFWSVTATGEPADDTKHTYCHAFAVYALSAYFMVSGDRGALVLARDIFDLMESKCADAEGYLESFARDFRPEANEKLSENGVVAERTMNTLLHVFEGYAGLYEATGDVRVGRAMRDILGIFEEKVYNPALRRQEVFFDKTYHSLIDLTSYGHDIETSWLLDWGCGLLGDRELSERIGLMDSSLCRNVFESAFDGHSVANERERGVTDGTRIWWVQAEAVLGFVNQWEKDPQDRRFLDAAEGVFDFIRSRQTDSRCGEWFWAVDRQGVPDRTQPMVSPWKCPYHNGRMCLEIIRRDPHA